MSVFDDFLSQGNYTCEDMASYISLIESFVPKKDKTQYEQQLVQGLDNLKKQYSEKGCGKDKIKDICSDAELEMQVLRERQFFNTKIFASSSYNENRLSELKAIYEKNKCKDVLGSIDRQYLYKVAQKNFTQDQSRISKYTNKWQLSILTISVLGIAAFFVLNKRKS